MKIIAELSDGRIIEGESKIPQAKGMYTALLGSHSHLKKEDRDELTIRLHALYENFQIMLLRGGGKQ